MGVIGRDNRTFVGLIEDVQNNAPEAEAQPPVNDIEVDNNIINEVINVAAQAEVEEELLRQEAAAASTPKRIKHRNPVKPTSFTLRTKGLGAKKRQRYENALQMLDSVNVDEDVDEISIGDFMNNRMSAFSKLLEERANLKLWNDFINCSEEKQHQLLAPTTGCNLCEAAMKSRKEAHHHSDGQSSSKSQGNVSKQTGLPGDSPKVCFHRIGNGFRALIKKKQVPMGVLSHLESEIIEFFSNWPRSVYVSQLPNGFERLLLHALCQYLNLAAESFGSKENRHTRVENPREEFQTPPVLLTQFIQNSFRQL